MTKDLRQLFDEGEGQEQSECLAQCPAIPIPLEGAADECGEVGGHHSPGQEHIQDLIEYILK